MATINGTNSANTLVGTNGSDILRGFGGNDQLVGLGGLDRLDGGTGIDRMRGGTGNDVYVVGSAGDRVIENRSEGFDLILSSISRTLDANVENLQLTGGGSVSGVGNALINTINGNNATNILRGLDGNDTLRGRSGNDRLEGGNGQDRIDGGLGNDRMFGGSGHDAFVVNSAGDRVFESGGGIDTVHSSLAFDLATTGEVEHLTLTGTGNIAGRGNDLSNVIHGNGRNNLLLGRDHNDSLFGGGGNDILDGGAGNDVMNGNAGNDVYRVDSAGDTVDEGSDAGGRDRVESFVAFDLSGRSIEDLTLKGFSNIDGTGNNLRNTIIGNDGDNALSGGDDNDILIGGRGGDDLTGGAGADLFRYESVLDNVAGLNQDQIFDFTGADGDTIDLRSIDAVSGTPANDTFSFIGTTAFSNVAGQLRYSVVALGLARLIEGDVDGDGTADFAIATNAADYDAADFIL
jgi:Ca2+-binding RTX toxin-like protein